MHFDSRCENWLTQKRLSIFLTVSTLGLLFAWANRFVQDDAFIAFIYSRNLVDGQGLTWFGNKVEGFTDFLWVLWISLGLKIGYDPILWAHLGGMTAFGITEFVLWHLSLALFQNTLPALFTLLIFISNYSVSSYATGGLETMLQTAFLTTAIFLTDKLCYQKESNHIGFLAAGLSLTLAGSVMTRPDSVVPSAVMGIIILVHFLRRKVAWRNYIPLVLPFMLSIGSWTIWRLSYYHRLFPNTFYAKVGWKAAMLENGLLFIGRFFHWYLLWPFFLVGLILLATYKRDEWKAQELPQRMATLVLIVVSWLAYIVWIGGDFMEFRMFIPIMPPVCLLLTFLVIYPISDAIGKGKRGLSCLVVFVILLSMSIHHQISFRGITKDKSLDSIWVLSTFYGLYPDGNWGLIGDALREKLADANPILALHPVGAIPFYSGFRTIDQLGLTDAYVARQGNPSPPIYRRPGHQRHAPIQYLQDQGVNLIIGHPTLVPLNLFTIQNATAFIGRWIKMAVSFESHIPDKIHLLVLPLKKDVGLLTWYLVPSNRIDALITKNGWPAITVDVGNQH